MLILASKSERRIKLLKDVGLDFETVEHKVSETYPKGANPQTIVQTLSKRKAEGTLKAYPNATIIAADTIVFFEDEVLGKPKDEDDAFKMLKKLSGNKHQVYTGVTIINKNKSKTFYCVADVYMKNYHDIEIYEYIKTTEPLDKAGSYAIQGEGSKLVEKYVGDFFTIVGLPVKQLQKELKKFDY